MFSFIAKAVLDASHEGGLPVTRSDRQDIDVILLLLCIQLSTLFVVLN